MMQSSWYSWRPFCYYTGFYLGICEMHSCVHVPKARQMYIQSLFFLHRLHLSWGHWDLLLPATMLIYIIKDLALKTLLIQPWLPPVSPAIGERWNNILQDFLGWVPTPGKPTLDMCGVGQHTSYEHWVTASPQRPREDRLLCPAPKRCSGTASSEHHFSSGLTQYISRSIYAVFTAHSTVATSKV